ncbi:MAG: phospholipid/glycerol acyltransferase [Chitinophagaceae bacterium]|nr:phospholipid/glycerol acyltransferase [Chitinophagaceae bacterium]
MKFIKEILGRIFAIWGLLLFVITMLIFLIPFLLFSYSRPDPLKNIRFITMSRVWMKVYLTLIGCPLKVTGKENFSKGESYIVVCNHNSFMDVPITSPAIPGGNKTIAKAELAKTPIFGLMYKTGSILVDRKSETSRKESFAKMKQVLDMGLHMCIYPEGTRNKSDEPLKPFHDGAFKLAVASGKSIIPALIFNTRDILPANKFFLWPHRMQIDFLPPVAIKPGATYQQLKEEVFMIMKDYYVAHHH